MKKIVSVQPRILDSVLRDPFEPVTYYPHDLIYGSDLSLSARGLLLELVATEGDFDVEASRAAELKRRARGNEPEDIDELLAELEAAGYVTVTA